ncbi:JAB domain-containing protein [Altererythrobacter aquiaggeris]|uniref:JAB domain-containing protein n=1 Tax=Aestuarierythrobacter aquiaggeris TaxID=1898396 RepID=UPI003019778D
MAELLTPFLGVDAERYSIALISHFGSVGRVVAASEDQITKATGQRRIAEIIVGARKLHLAGLCEVLDGKVIHAGDPDLMQFLASKLCSKTQEIVFAVYLDGRGVFIRGEEVAFGVQGKVSIHIRSLVGRAIELGAAQLILAHNHPSGDSTPSGQDLAATTTLVEVAKSLEISIVDHCIVAGRNIFSMRHAGMLG